MSTIPSNPALLAQSLLSLSAQTQPAPTGSAADDAAASSAPTADTLTLSPGSQPTDLVAAMAQVEQQNLTSSALSDPVEALAANQQAVAFFANEATAATPRRGQSEPLQRPELILQGSWFSIIGRRPPAATQRTVS